MEYQTKEEVQATQKKIQQTQIAIEMMAVFNFHTLSIYKQLEW